MDGSQGRSVRGGARGCAVLIAIISDTHLPRGDRAIPEACLERMRAADHILHAGDISTLAVLEQLRALGPSVTAVHGNADEAALRELLPDRVELDFDGVRVAMVHNGGPAAGRLQRMRLRFPGAAHAVVFGHSHVPLHESAGGFQIFNPGSASDRRRQPQHTMGLARVQRGAIAFELVGLGR
jgi:putative phosphoesterase